MKLPLFAFLIFVCLLILPAIAGTNFDVKNPDTIITSVGKLTELKIEIFNKGSVSESYNITISASKPTIIEITNPSITTQSVNPNQFTSVSSNVRTLTEDGNALLITVKSGVTTETSNINISIKSKKISLPEFGLTGLLQIIGIAAIVYFLFTGKVKSPTKALAQGHATEKSLCASTF